MIKLSIGISRDAILTEVQKNSEYAGSKSEAGDDGAYDRIKADDADKDMLIRFFNDGTADITDVLKPFIAAIPSIAESYKNKEYSADLTMPDLYDSKMEDGINVAISAYLVNYITLSWYMFCDRKDAELYKAMCDRCLSDLRRKIYYRKHPILPS